MNFTSERQRKAMFASMGKNKFSLFDRVRSTSGLVGKRDEIIYKINTKRDKYSPEELSDMVEELNKLNDRIRDREKEKIADEGHGFVRKSVDSVSGFFHTPKSEPTYAMADQVQQPVVMVQPAEPIYVERGYPQEFAVEQMPVVEQVPAKKRSFADMIVNLYP